jgi:hypothetical protein
VQSQAESLSYSNIACGFEEPVLSLVRDRMLKGFSRVRGALYRWGQPADDLHCLSRGHFDRVLLREHDQMLRARVFVEFQVVQ